MKLSRNTAGAPAPSPPPPASVNAHEVYDRTELCRRLRWKRHAWRRARALGLRVTRFGARDYIAGADILAFFAGLAQQQAEKPAGETTL